VITALLLTFRLHGQVSDRIYYQNFQKALKNTSTAQSYFVVIVHDQKLDREQEVCLNRNQLRHALSSEHKKNLSKITTLIDQNTDRKFSFSKSKAINYLMKLNEYTSNELTTYAKSLNLDSLIKEDQMAREKVMKYKEEGNLSAILELLEKYPNALNKRFVLVIHAKRERLMAAHISFNRGMSVTNGDDLGSVLYLHPVPILYPLHRKKK